MIDSEKWSLQEPPFSSVLPLLHSFPLLLFHTTPEGLASMSTSALQISLLRPEEAELYMRIRHETFRPTVNKILYSRGEPSQKTLDRVTSEIRDGIINKGIMFLKCVDITTGEMIAGARWRYVKPKEDGAKERTWDEVDAGLDVPEPFDESDPEMLESLFTVFNEHKRKNLGRQPYFVLDTLVTLPEHERRGAGSKMVQWGCKKADEAGVVAYLEASVVGAPMYARHGFEPLEEIELDLRKWGGTDIMTFIVSVLQLCFASTNKIIADVEACKKHALRRINASSKYY
jgi:GNAT superfamily N-acetyltransferase